MRIGDILTNPEPWRVQVVRWRYAFDIFTFFVADFSVDKVAVANLRPSIDTDIVLDHLNRTSY
jgi:hypothetical protein